MIIKDKKAYAYIHIGTPVQAESCINIKRAASPAGRASRLLNQNLLLFARTI